MAQSFSYRYPLVDGQGNFGSPDDPKSFAAMRYTESRLTPYAALLLSRARPGHGRVGAELRRHARRAGAAAGARAEPAAERRHRHRGRHGHRHSAAQPARSRDRLRARCSMSRTRTLRELCQHIKGPDFPTGAEIISPRDEMARCYETGNGSIRARAIYEIEDGEIVITQLPYQVSGAKVQEQIAAQMQAKKLPMVEDVRDESDHEHPTRLVIVPRSNRVDTEQLMAHLFATTDLERTYRVNLNIIGLDGRPKVMGLKELLEEWLQFRIDTVTRRLNWRLEKVARRLHILDGLLDRLSESRRGDPHHPPRGRAEAGADEALQAVRRAGRGDPRDQAAPPREARGNEDPRRAEGARRRARGARGDPRRARRGSSKLVREELLADAEEYRRRAPHARSSSAKPRRRSTRRSWSPASRSPSCCRRAAGCAPPRATISIRASLELQDGRCVPGGGARPHDAAGRVPRQHRSGVQPAGAHAAVGARAGRAAVRHASIRRTARRSPAS